MRIPLSLAVLMSAALVFLLGAAAVGPAHAQDCATNIPKDDIDGPEAQRLYDCIADSLYEGYQGSGLPEAAAYKGWTHASTAPYLSATHGARFVNNLVNDTGRDAYLDYLDTGFKTPVGSIVAKESFTIDKAGNVKRGPLFFMEKVARGGLPETDDWKYALVLPNGKVMGVSGTETGPKVKFCHDCHESVLESQDAMFYPPREYRVSR